MDHTELKTASDRLAKEHDILRTMATRPLSDPRQVTLMLQQAKRVRSSTNLVVRALARIRDSYSPKEDTSE